MRSRLLLLPLTAFFFLEGCGNEPSPVLIGQATSASSQAGRMNVEINGEARDVAVGRNDTYAMQQLPTGELIFRVEVEGIRGTIEVSDVQPGEVIEVDAFGQKDSLELRVMRRDAPPAEWIEPEHDGPSLVIAGDHVVHHLEPGSYENIRIKGDHVTLVGPDEYGCRDGGRAIVEHNLIVDGKHARIINVKVKGDSIIRGDHARIYRSCELYDRYGRDYEED